MTRRLEMLDVEELVSAPRNPKAHDEATMEASLARFGMIDLIVRDDRTGRLVSGHGRMEALRRRKEAGADAPEGVEETPEGRWLVPVVVGWRSRDDDHAAGAVIALNRIGERGGWKRDELAEVLGELEESGFGLDDLGFDRAELDDLLAVIQEADRDESFNDERRHGDGAHAESSIAEWGENYRNKQVRSMVFDYPLDDYRIVAEQATRARRELGVESNAELFQRLLADWTEAHPVEQVTASA